jgi:hypothetical protein
MALAMQKTVKATWEDIFKSSGFTEPEIQRVRTC